MEQADRYLWEVYQRAPTKRDHSGDFTWKDPAAAKRMGMSVPEYVIGGMDADFREQLADVPGDDVAVRAKSDVEDFVGFPAP